MKLKKFTSLLFANEFLNDPEKVIKKVTVVPHDETEDAVYVLYEDTDEALTKEKEELNELDRVAQELERDEDYQLLRNTTQRELYLLTKYNIPSSTAKRVIELVNMRRILQG
ncbi:MAG: hypothetical protein DRN29_04875 [Thermoplasmata archaeon]|nr:MAG: hypothetical protein DRN29_04875 [Thermoplasmata archaeon]